MGAIRAIPPGLPRSTWMRGIVSAHKLMMKDELEDRSDRGAVDDLVRNLQRKVRPRLFEIGEMVLLARGKDTRDGHKLRGKGQGPWRIAQVLNDAVELDDAFTGRPLMDNLTKLPDRISTDRLLRFAGNIEHLEVADLENQLSLGNARSGGYVAFLNDQHVWILRITSIEEDVKMTGNPGRVPTEERYGAAARRPWKVDEEQRITALWSTILCIVDLDDTGCLTPTFLSRLERLGVDLIGWGD
jgi:hypothetical protein